MANDFVQELNYLINKGLAAAPEVGILAVFYEVRKKNLSTPSIAGVAVQDAQNIANALGISLADAYALIAGTSLRLGQDVQTAVQTVLGWLGL